ncbi:MAG: amidase [Parvularculaceae bacterium]|nr:amidase [Parvularculaceae bacterium]
MRQFLLGSAAFVAAVACTETQAPAEAPVEQSNPRAALAPAPDPAQLPMSLKEGETTPRAVLATYLRRIELLDRSGPTLQSVIALNPNAVSDAQLLEEALAEGAEPSALYGLPILIKDNIETRELPTTAGSKALLANDTGRDAPAVANLRAEGAVILGKTNLSEWANFRGDQSVSGWSAVGGLVKNPHDLSRNACGSSSGSGAAVAAGLAWAALGTETNGSVTCPAALNGIVGLKPTVGLVSRTHVVPISVSQDTIGPMTTSVLDAAMLLTAMAGSDPADEATAEADERKVDYVAALEGASLEGVRLGVLRWAQSGDSRERAVFDAALARAEEAGAILVDIDDWGGERFGGDPFTVLKAEFKDTINAYLADTAPEVETRTLEAVIAFNEADPDELVLFGQEVLTASREMAGMDDDDYRQALANVRQKSRENGIDRLLTENDVELLVAPSFGPAFVTDLIRGDIIASNAGAGWLAAYAGYPHLTLPMGDVGGLPLGLSIIGTAWDDATVLSAGQAFENVLPPRLNPSFRSSAAELPPVKEVITP